MSHNKRESLLAIHLHINELLHIETKHIIIITSIAQIHEHRLTILYLGQIQYHARHWDSEEVTSRLDCIMYISIAQSELIEAMPTLLQEIIHRWALEELGNGIVEDV